MEVDQKSYDLPVGLEELPARARPPDMPLQVQVPQVLQEEMPCIAVNPVNARHGNAGGVQMPANEPVGIVFVYSRWIFASREQRHEMVFAVAHSKETAIRSIAGQRRDSPAMLR